MEKNEPVKFCCCVGQCPGCGNPYEVKPFPWPIPDLPMPPYEFQTPDWLKEGGDDG